MQDIWRQKNAVINFLAIIFANDWNFIVAFDYSKNYNVIQRVTILQKKNYEKYLTSARK